MNSGNVFKGTLFVLCIIATGTAGAGSGNDDDAVVKAHSPAVQASVPDLQRKPATGSKALPDATRALPEDAARNAFQGREAAHAREAAEAARGMAELEEVDLMDPEASPLRQRDRGGRYGELGTPDPGRMESGQDEGRESPTGLPMPDVQGNRSKEPRGADRLRPSMNLRDHADGLAGQDSGGKDHGDVVGQETSTETLDTGSESITRQTHYEDGTVVTERSTLHADGSSTRFRGVDNGDGTGHAVYEHSDAEGNVTDRQRFDFTENHTIETSVAGEGGCNPVTGICRGAGINPPDRVNPGDPDDRGPDGPRLEVDREGLVRLPRQAQPVATGDAPVRRPDNYDGARVNPERPGGSPD